MGRGAQGWDKPSPEPHPLPTFPLPVLVFLSYLRHLPPLPHLIPLLNHLYIDPQLAQKTLYASIPAWLHSDEHDKAILQCIAYILG